MLIGAIADDLTGATDLALMIARQRMKTVQVVGIPETDADFGDADAVVVALKSRTIPRDEAVDLSLRAAERLRAAGAQQLFFKYCSTFDSTDKGNIGAVAEALLDNTESELTIACPAFPANRRSVYRGHLFVGDSLLSDSSMKDHPLTPMRDSNLVRVLQRQVKGRVGLIDLDVVEAGVEAVRQALDQARSEGLRFLIVDAIRDEHLRTIGAAAAGMPLVTGGSGLAMGLPHNFEARGGFVPTAPDARMQGPAGRAVILAGSCSAATRSQVGIAIARGTPARQLDAFALAENRVTVGEIVDWIAAQPKTQAPLVYSSANPDDVHAVQQSLGAGRSRALVEDFFAAIAKALTQRLFSRFLVAGGETSGAVVNALGVRALRIGPEIDPGVPWTRSLGKPDVALALKSGNFGAPDFFQKAWKYID